MLIDHLSAGACPATDCGAVDVGFYTQADESVAALVALPVGNVTGFEDGLPGAGGKVVLVDELPLGTRK